MPRITKVVALNLKSLKSLKLPITKRVILLIGQNGSGKTSVTQAVKLAVNGSLPEINQKDIFKLARVGEGIDHFSVGLEFGDSFQFIRDWNRRDALDKDGNRTEKISQGINLVPMNEERTIADHEARIKKQCGIDPIMVDVQEFLGLSDNKRRDYFYKLGGTQTLTLEVIQLELRRNFPPDEMASFWEILLAEVATNWKKRPDLDALLSWLDEEQKAATRNMRQAQAGAQQMVKLRTEKETVAGLLENIETELNNSRSRKEQIVSEIAKSGALARAVIAHEEQIKSLATRIAEFEKAKEEKFDLAAGERKLADLEVQEKNVQVYYDEQIGKLQNEVLLFEAQAEVERADHEKIGHELSGYQGQKDGINQAIGQKGLLCDHCIYTLTERISELPTVIQSFSLKLYESQGRLLQCLDSLNEKKKEIRGTEIEQGHRLSVIESEIKTVRERLEYDRNRLPQIGQGIANLKKELEQVKASPVEEPLPVDTLQAELGGLKYRITELETNLNAKRAERQNIETQLTILAQAETSENRLFCLKKAIKILGPAGLKGDLVKAILDPIKSEVNICLTLFRCEHEFDFRTVDGRGNEVFQFGWIDNGVFIDFESFSTGQQTILLACLAAVICKRSTNPLKFLALDNIETISSDYETNFLRSLPELAANCELDNLFVATSKNIMVDPELLHDVQVVQCPIEETDHAAK